MGDRAPSGESALPGAVFNRRIFLGAGVAALGAVGLAACGGSSSSSGGTSSGGGGSATGEVTFGSNGSSPLFGAPALGRDGDTVVLTATDPAAGLALRTEVALAPAGLLRIRHVLTNTGPDPYGLEGLRVALPLPARAGELLDFTGRWCRERSPQRHPLAMGGWVRESRAGRTGHDATLGLCAGTPGFGFGTGEVWALHVAWSGDHVTYAERAPARRRRAAAPGRGRAGAGGVVPDAVAVRGVQPGGAGRDLGRLPRVAAGPAGAPAGAPAGDAQRLGGRLLRPRPGPAARARGRGRRGRGGAVRAGRRLVPRPPRRHRRARRLGGRPRRSGRAGWRR